MGFHAPPSAQSTIYIVSSLQRHDGMDHERCEIQYTSMMLTANLWLVCYYMGVVETTAVTVVSPLAAWCDSINIVATCLSIRNASYGSTMRCGRWAVASVFQMNITQTQGGALSVNVSSLGG